MQKHFTAIPNTPLAFFRFALRPHVKWVVFVLITIVIASTISQSTSYFFKLIIDAAEAGDLDQALWWGILYPVAVFLTQMLYRLNGLLTSVLSNRAGKTSFDSIIDYVMGHSHGYYSNRFAGSVVNKVRNVYEAIQQTIPDVVFAHINSLVAFLVTYALISSVDVWSGLIFLALLFSLGIVNAKLSPQKAILSRSHADAGSALQARFNDTIGSMSAVRQYAQTNTEQTELEKLSSARLHTGIRNWVYTEKMFIINTFVIFVFSLGIFWLLINRWGAGDISTGDFVLVLALVLQITGAMMFIGRAFNTTAKVVGELREALEDLLLPHEITDAPDATTLTASKGHIIWNQVQFEYDNERIFENFSLEIKPHERIGLVGPSGAGKSTFVSLLLRQHDIQQGNITIDNQSIGEVTQSSLRDTIGIVPQEPILFHRTIRENIAYGKTNATQEDIQNAARHAFAHDFITKLPQGYDTLVGERGVKLSGGQKQRITIARAMLKNAPILILDEATSALDSESEVVIQKALYELMRGKTVIAIAHRLSTLREMDRILVMDNGQIVEEGSHNELKSAGGLYQRLWEHQAGGFQNAA